MKTTRRRFIQGAALLGSGAVLGLPSLAGELNPEHYPIITGEFEDPTGGFGGMSDSVVFLTKGRRLDRKKFLKENIFDKEGPEALVDVTINRNGRTYYWPDRTLMTRDIKDERGYVVRWD